MFDFLVNSQYYQDVAYKHFEDKDLELSMPAVIRTQRNSQFIKMFQKYCAENNITPVPSKRWCDNLLKGLPAKNTRCVHSTYSFELLIISDPHKHFLSTNLLLRIFYSFRNNIKMQHFSPFSLVEISNKKFFWILTSKLETLSRGDVISTNCMSITLNASI